MSKLAIFPIILSNRPSLSNNQSRGLGDNPVILKDNLGSGSVKAFAVKVKEGFLNRDPDEI
jgi:hypothetical protein